MILQSVLQYEEISRPLYESIRTCIQDNSFLMSINTRVDSDTNFLVGLMCNYNSINRFFTTALKDGGGMNVLPSITLFVKFPSFIYDGIFDVVSQPTIPIQVMDVPENPPVHATTNPDVTSHNEVHRPIDTPDNVPDVQQDGPRLWRNQYEVSPNLFAPRSNTSAPNFRTPWTSNSNNRTNDGNTSNFRTPWTMNPNHQANNHVPTNDGSIYGSITNKATYISQLAHIPYDQKNFVKKDGIPVLGKLPWILWYKRYVSFALRHGIFVPPFESMEADNIMGTWYDDIPNGIKMNINQMSGNILTTLTAHSILPDGNEWTEISSHDCGYAALYNVFRRIHPILLAEHVETFQLTLAPDKYIAIADRREHMSLNIGNLRHITSIHHDMPSTFTDNVPYTDTQYIHAVSTTSNLSEPISDEELACQGNFTRRKLKSLATWPLWQTSERNQLDKMHEQNMFGPPCIPPDDAIILRQV
jgi:hypothetical protein